MRLSLDTALCGYWSISLQLVANTNNTVNNDIIKFKKEIHTMGRGTLTPQEEELKKVFNILKAYGEVDEVPSAMLESGLSERVDKLLGELDRLLKK